MFACWHKTTLLQTPSHKFAALGFKGDEIECAAWPQLIEVHPIPTGIAYLPMNVGNLRAVGGGCHRGPIC